MRPSRSSRPRRSSASRPSCLRSTLCPARSRRCSRKRRTACSSASSRRKKLLGGDEKIILTGAPVRGEILAASREKARAKFGLGENDQLVVSFWGSMGAKYMNEHMAGTLALECKNGVSTTMSTPPARRRATGCRKWRASRARTSRTIPISSTPNTSTTWRTAWRRPTSSCAARVRRRSASCACSAVRRCSCRPLRRREPSGEERTRARVGRRLPRAARKGRHAAEAV